MIEWRIDEVLERHRGPYTLVGFYPPRFRRRRTEKGNSKTLLAQRVETEDVGELVLAFLFDPRDTIEAIGVWSEAEEQYATYVPRRHWEHLNLPPKGRKGRR